MRAFAQMSKTGQAAKPDRSPILHNGNARGHARIHGLTHNFGRIPVYSTATPVRIQSKLTANTPGDIYEREADQVAADVLRAPQAGVQRACACGGTCPKCSANGHDRASVQRTKPPMLRPMRLTRPFRQSLQSMTFFARRDNRWTLRPADSWSRGSATNSDACAYTWADRRRCPHPRSGRVPSALGNRIVFGAGSYAPATEAGRSLIAHELTHVLQQGSTPRPMRQTETPVPAQEDENHKTEAWRPAGLVESPYAWPNVAACACRAISRSRRRDPMLPNRS